MPDYDHMVPLRAFKGHFEPFWSDFGVILSDFSMILAGASLEPIAHLLGYSKLFE